jgi:hypothetical protein
MSEQQTSVSHALLLTAVISSAFGLIGSILILTTYVISRRVHQNQFFFWVFHLAITDFFLSMGSFYDWQNVQDTECTLFSMMTGFGIIGSYVFISCIAVFIYKTLKREYATSFIEKKRKHIVISTYIIILILVTGPIFTKSYGIGAEYCWLDTGVNMGTANLIWTIIEYYIPIAICIPYITYLYFMTYKEATSDNPEMKKIRRLLWVPLLYVIGNCFALADRIFKDANGEQPGAFQYLHILFRQLQGCYHAIIYGYSYIKVTLTQETLLSNKASKKNEQSNSNLPESFF